MELIGLYFNHSGECPWSPEGTVSQIHSPHLHAGTPEIFSDLLWSVQMLKREWGAESNGKLPHPFIPSKTATVVTSLQWKTCLQQNCSVDSCVCSETPDLGEKTLMMMNMMMVINKICHCCTVIYLAICKFLRHLNTLRSDLGPIFLNFSFINISAYSKY